MFPMIPKPQSVTEANGKVDIAAKIKFLADTTLAKDGYRIAIDASGVTVWSCQDGGAGAFYAEKTLQMLRDTLGYYPFCTVEDAPKCAYRAVMLDVGRYFYPVADVKKLIDSAAQLKLNVFHWHLTEDQGWRAEILAYPRLTEIGSKRTKTNWFPIPNEGFYTQDEMREVVQYAHRNHMIVVPEVDVPGHVRAAIAAYSELSCFHRDLPVANHFGVKHDILCAGAEFTYNFLYGVFKELTQIFSDGYFHLGSDEAVKMRWQLCPACQKVIKEQGLKDEDALQVYFLNRLNREFFKPANIRPMIWSHTTAPEGLDKEIILMQYGGNSAEIMKQSAAAGYTSILAESTYFYFDLPHPQVTMRAAYSAGEILEPQEAVLGGSASIWTEYIPRMKTLEKRVYPRILAAAEALWTKYDEGEYNNFIERAKCFQNTYGKGKNFTSVEYAQKTTGLRVLIDKLWWARRPLHWEGLGNLIDDYKVKKFATKNIKK